jgi:hypothetical protein
LTNNAVKNGWLLAEARGTFCKTFYGPQKARVFVIVYPLESRAKVRLRAWPFLQILDKEVTDSGKRSSLLRRGINCGVKKVL